MQFQKRLFTPGPTEVPSQVLAAMAKPLVHHRTDDFRNIHLEIVKQLQAVYKTKNPIAVLSASGTGAMEAAVANLTVPREKVLVTPCGKFSERWYELAVTYNLDIVRLDTQWGKAVTPEMVDDYLTEHPDITTVFTTHCETSTGVIMDIEAIARVVHDRGAIIVVDAISSLCAHTIETDGWDLDAVIGGAQKGFMTPPGLSFVSLNKKALKRAERKVHPVFYFDLVKAVKSLKKGDTPYTPAIPLFVALHEALSLIKYEGLENTIRRHERNAHAMRAALTSLGIPLFSESPCNATTVVLPPEGMAEKIQDAMEASHGIRIAGGQMELKGKVLRFGHLGFYNETDMCTVIASLEAVLMRLKINPAPGKGMEALLTAFQEG
jgi:aspartate aminotransferase-like enzyme